MTSSMTADTGALSSLRRWAWIEGVSLLVLVLVAMPLKHLAGMPMAVRVTGLLHGLAFLFFVTALARASSERKWPAKTWLAAFGLSLVPGGVFFLHRVLDARTSDSAENPPLPRSDDAKTL